MIFQDRKLKRELQGRQVPGRPPVTQRLRGMTKKAALIASGIALLIAALYALASDDAAPWKPDDLSLSDPIRCPPPEAFAVFGSNEWRYADGNAASARFWSPTVLAADRNGNIFVADSGNNLIRKIDPEGRVTVVAGIPGKAGHEDGSLQEATFFSPRGIAVDSEGNLYIADTYSYAIRKVSPDGRVMTLAGGGLTEKRVYSDGSSRVVPVFEERDGVGHNATFGLPDAIAIGPDGFLYVTDSEHESIRRVSRDGEVTTIAGNMPNRMKQSGYQDGLTSSALLNHPHGVAVDVGGNVYFADNNAVRKLSPSGTVSTVAGGQKMYFRAPALFPGHDALEQMFSSGSSRDGAGTDAHFAGPVSLAVDSSGRILVGQKILPAVRLVNPDRQVTTILGPGDSLCGIGDLKDPRPSVMSVVFLNDGRIAFTAGNAVFVQKAAGSLKPSP
jgi:sugar lactone lactonase YvrE